MKGYAARIDDASRVEGAAYDILGDVHGCWDELVDALQSAGWKIPAADLAPGAPDPIAAHHPEGRHLVFAGDLTDRGPRSDLVLRLALGTMNRGHASWVIGNHDWKLARHLRGNPVQICAGLAQTLEQIAPCGERFAARVRETILSLPYQIRLPMPEGHPRAGDGVMTVVHGAAPAHHLDGGRENSFERSIYGYGTGENADGSLRRADWAADYGGPRWIVHGHEPHAEVVIKNRVIALDTGCVFGNRLSLYRADDTSVISIPARANHSGITRSFY